MKNMKETIKTIVIAVLLSAIISFVAGAHYQAGISKVTNVAHAEAVGVGASVPVPAQQSK